RNHQKDPRAGTDSPAGGAQHPYGVLARRRGHGTERGQDHSLGPAIGSEERFRGRHGLSGECLMAFLTISDLSVTFGNVRALDKVSFSIERNEIVTIVGANGAGKSTLMRAVMGLAPIL